MTNRNAHKNVQQRSLLESSTNGKKTEKLLFSLLDNPTQFNSFDFNMEMKILIILKMPFLIPSDIFDLMLVLVLVNYFGNLS